MTFATLLFALIALPAGAERSGEPVMLDFTATWCGPCQSMKPIVKLLVDKGYPIRAVDIDDNGELAERYKVTGVPTFVVVDPADGRELARISGARPADQLAQVYRDAKAKFIADRADEAAAPETRSTDDSEEPAERAGADESRKPNPEPWETVVRIKVHDNGAMGMGSGTIIYSTPNEALILTCAHIFKMDGRRQVTPDRFPLRITVDLFDGRLTGTQPSQVHYANETYEGKAVDYDFTRDVGLIRIRPGRRLPYAKVVPPYWTPKKGHGMITVGCSEGADASAWRTTITNPAMKGLQGNGTYEAIECFRAPKQGRSGGGLFTSDGYVAGVCDFAEPRGNHGLYAAPSSIYKILDRNKMTALYNPQADDRLLADRGQDTRRASQGAIERLQSPDPDAPGAVTLPDPQLLGIGIKVPKVSRTEAVVDTGRRPEQGAGRRSWHAGQGALTAQPAEIKLDASLDPDPFGSHRPEPESEPVVADESRPAPEPVKPRSGGSKWRAGRTPLPGLTGTAN